MPANNPTPPADQPPKHSWIYRRIALPVLALLRLGASPERLAWSLAIGLLVGINPVLGSTTAVCLALAFVFRLNIAASQLANHLVYPLQLLLLLPFLHLGTRLFGADSLPLSPTDLLHAARSAPLALSRRLWHWERDALLIWLLFAVVAVPAFALLLTPILRRLQTRIRHHEYPLIPTPLIALHAEASDDRGNP